MGQLPVEQTVLSVVMLYQFVNAGYLKLNRDSNAVLENPHLDGLLNNYLHDSEPLVQVIRLQKGVKHIETILLA